MKVQTKSTLTRRSFITAATGASLSIASSVSTQTTPFATEQLTTNAQVSNGKPPVIGIYYYPWYKAPKNESIGWMRKALRGRLEPKQLPKIGVYSSQDADTVAGHIAQCKRGGVNFWTVSWWGPNHKTDTVFKDHILPHPNAGKLKYTLFYESTGRFGSFDNPNFKSLLDDFKYMANNYFDHPHYLKIDDKPVVYIYLTRAYFRNRGHDELKHLREQLPNMYLIGDDVFGPNYRSEYAQLWDAVTAYDGYGQSLPKGGATRAGLKRLKANYINAKEIANSVGTGFIPGVSPGYNDKAVRDGHVGRARYFNDIPNSKEGDLFRAMIREVALPNIDPQAASIMMVNSFNEWYEDTQIEATAGTAPPTAKDDSESGKYYTEGEIYTDYGYLYLDILREESERKR